MPSIPSSGIRIALRERPIVYRYGLALFSVAMAAACRFWFQSYFKSDELSPFITFYPAVMLAVWYGGLGSGLLATCLSLVTAFFFFAPPIQFFSVEGPSEFIQLILFTFVSLSICFLTDNLHRSLLKQRLITQELLSSQKKISNILESVQGCFFSLDNESRFTHINECKDYLPQPREHYYGKSLWEAFPNWQGTEFEGQIRRVMKAKQSLGFEFFDPKKGAWYEVHLAPSSEGVSVHIYNITRRKEAEVVLNENEAHFRQVADQAPVMIWMAGPDALSQYFNERWLKFRGHKLDQELGDGWAKGIHPHEREERIDTYLRAFHARESFRVEYRLKRADGRYRWILDSGVPRFSLGKFLGYIGSAIDITARKEAEDRQILEHKITQHLTEEASLDATLEKIMQIICEGLDWQLGAYWQVEPLLKQVRCRQTWSRNEPELRRFIEKDKVTSFNYGVGLPGRVWSLGKAFWILDIIEDPNFIREAAAQQAGLRSGICFPIRLGEEILGVMEFFSQEIQEPDANLLQMLESIGVEIGQFIERIKTKEALKTAYEEMEKRVQDRTAQLAQTNEALLEEIGERKKVEKEVLEISQKEQRRFGAHLHDDLCQDLSGIMMLAKVLMQNLEGKKIPEWEELKHITYLLDQSISQAKEMARGLYPIEVKSDSLMISLRDLTKRLEGLYQISCRFICPDPVLIEDNNLATHLYRIAQEAVQNAIKHGEADQVDIRLLQGKKSIVLTIHDNGHGLRPDTRSGTGIGLQIMKYRARMIDAELKIQENPEGGMLLTCSFSRTKYENHSSYAEETSAGSTSGEARV